jgi:hypothetical protein
MATARPVAATSSRPAPRRWTTALAGGLAGLATGAACMSWAPAVGRGAGIGDRVGAAPVAASFEVEGRARWRADAPVAAVLAPAAQAGVVAASLGQAKDGRP